MRADVVLAAGAQLGEGPIWDARRGVLWWVDILGHALHAFDPGTGDDRTWPVGEYIGTVVPAVGGGLVLALTRRVVHFDPETGTLRDLARLPESAGNVRFNDGKCDPQGRFWVGTLSLEGRNGQGVLYRLDPDGVLREQLAPVTTSNGLAWSADSRTMYYIDTRTSRVDAFDFDPEAGAIANRRPVIEFDGRDGRPDGMTIDVEGMLWVAHWAGGCVTRHDPADGQVLVRIDVAAPNTTACWFGGPDLATLFITSARRGMPEGAEARYPDAGHLFAAHPGPRGLPAAVLRG